MSSETFSPYDSPPPERRGMSGTTKVLLGLGIGCGIVCLLCCGVFGIGGFMIARFVKNSLNTDPVKVDEMRDDMAELELPESFKPETSMDMQIPFVNRKFMTWVVYDDKATDSGIWMGQFDESFMNASNREELEEQFKTTLRQQGQHTDDLEIIESEDLEREVHDEPAHFKISKGKQKDKDEEFWQVVGQFRGKGGPAILIVRARSPEYSKEDVMKIVESIK